MIILTHHLDMGVRTMTAVAVPEGRRGWWGGPDLRPRCPR
jgi:hypothetical protein